MRTGRFLLILFLGAPWAAWASPAQSCVCGVYRRDKRGQLVTQTEEVFKSSDPGKLALCNNLPSYYYWLKAPEITAAHFDCRAVSIEGGSDELPWTFEK